MHDAGDMELLRQYDRQGSEAAFAALVQRHVNLVYSAAFRHVGIDAHAGEITQAVFIILARKAAGLRADTILESWLYETTRLTALSFLRSERRRQFREQEAYMRSTLNESSAPDAVWDQLAPLLDEAMARLGKKDRDAVVLRFFKDKNLREVAAALRVNEAAAQRRVHRAVEKLRAFFTKRGIIFPAAVLTTAIAANSVQAAPVTLAKSVTAVAIAKGAAASGSIIILVKGTMKTMTWLKTTLLAVILTNAIVSQKIVATHFDFAGNPDGWMTHSNYVVSSLMFGCGFPLFFVAIGYLPRFLPIKAFNIPHRDYWLAPERRDETFNYLFRHSLWQACFTAIFALALQLLVVQANHQTPLHFSSSLAWVAAGCFLLATVVLIGILLRHFKHITTHTHI
jgi:RNA polymerase sigma factor (sigma-70 family)